MFKVPTKMFFNKILTFTEADISGFVEQILKGSLIKINKEILKNFFLGLEYIHSQKIVHLDIKPENIVCESVDSFNIKIVDFGLSRRLTEDRNKPCLVIGDFNICNKKQFRNSVKVGMTEQGFVCLTSEATQIKGGYIDHAYWRDDERIFMEPDLERHSPYYSDHDALCVTIGKKVSMY